MLRFRKRNGRPSEGVLFSLSGSWRFIWTVHGPEDLVIRILGGDLNKALEAIDAAGWEVIQ